MSFWQTKTWQEMTDSEWESLCDGCGQCCLHKLEDEDSGDVALTRIACDLLDLKTCRCQNYSQRTQLVSGCLDLRKREFSEYHYWLPKTCAYRLLGEGKDLPDWHPLVTGTLTSVSAAGISVSGYAIKSYGIDEADYEDYITEWLD